MLTTDVIFFGITAVILGYLIGSVPFGLVLTKLAGYGDIRKIGSGNIGATNVLRTGNKKLALAVLILDSAKGAFAVEIAKWMSIWLSIVTENFYFELRLIPLITGFAAILGHIFPAWLGFKGGKGVATALGTFLAAVPIAGVVACVFWLMAASVFQVSSLAALIAMAAAPVATLFIYGPWAGLISLGISALVILRHKDNIKRLLKGHEPKINIKKKNVPSPHRGEG